MAEAGLLMAANRNTTRQIVNEAEQAIKHRHTWW
jgi:hypothetical protein